VSELGDPVRLGSCSARNRFVFGPHVTNLGRKRSISERHVAYYRARAAGGVGVIVTEEASVDASDWPYERAPLASECSGGWTEVAAACHKEGALVLAAIGHAGGQGSSAYHQQALLAPSSVPDVVTREVPKAMEPADLTAVVAGFAAAAGRALSTGCDGVEVNAGQWSLLRQFCSGLTNTRDDGLGADRSALLAQVLDAVRAAGPGIVGLRFSCDELAPWAGIVPETAAAMLAGLAGRDRFDYVTVVRGSAYGTGATSPDGHVGPGFNRDATALVRQRLPAHLAVVAQGSIVDVPLAAEIVGSGEADLVEMTRALIADAALPMRVLAGEPDRIRPCTLCNQACQVRDLRNPLVSCITDPHTGYESEEPDVTTASPAGRPVTGIGAGAPATTSTATGLGVREMVPIDGAGKGADPGADETGRPGRVLVVGGGPAGLECARVAALGGLPVTLLERSERLGGMVVTASKAPGRQRLAKFVDWLVAECNLGGVEIVTGHEVALEELDAHAGPVVCCTGSRQGRRGFAVAPFAPVLTAAEVLEADRLVGEPPLSPAVVFDPIGGPIGIGVAELLSSLGATVTLVTPDFVAGDQLARTGDLAPASVRLQQAGVVIAKRSVVRSVDTESVVLEHRDSGETTTLPAAVLVDAGHRLPEDTLFRAVSAARPGVFLAGDAVAPRTILESVLEGRRVAMNLCNLARAEPRR
jgi:2,4-dienoyl-CoA reductase (NADPH2)